jgi:hypothetical protein
MYISLYITEKSSGNGISLIHKYIICEMGRQEPYPPTYLIIYMLLHRLGSTDLLLGRTISSVPIELLN